MAKKAIIEDQRKEPRFYMKEAIKAMKSSVDELNKSSPSPRVGAVLVFPDGVFETASGENFGREIMLNIL